MKSFKKFLISIIVLIVFVISFVFLLNCPTKAVDDDDDDDSSAYHFRLDNNNHLA